MPTTTLTNGYNSDEHGPFFDAVFGEASEEESDREEETLQAQAETNVPVADPKISLLIEEEI